MVPRHNHRWYQDIQNRWWNKAVPLISGAKKIKTESITCSSLKRERDYDSGYYTLKNEMEPPKLGYCDMNYVDYTEDGSSTPTLALGN